MGQNVVSPETVKCPNLRNAVRRKKHMKADVEHLVSIR